MILSERGIDSSRFSAWALLCVVSACVLWAFFPELEAGPNQFSDVTFHLAIVQQMHDAVMAGGSPFDFWFDASPFGYALARCYQSLPHLTIYAVYRLLGQSVSLPTILISCTIALAALQPWSFYLMARKLGWPSLFAAFVGMLSVLVSEIGGYGMGMQNYSWGTHGIVTQLWALVFAAPAIGYAVQYIRTGVGLPITLLLVFLSCGSHLLSAHLLGFSIVTVVALLFVFGYRKHLLRRLCCLAGGCLLVILHQLATIIPDAPLIHKSVLEPQWKFASHGWEWVSRNLSNGNLFDYERVPVLSVLLLIGVALVLVDLFLSTEREKKVQSLFVFAGFLVWLSLLCGYEVWGVLFENLPVLRSMQMHRFIVGVHIFGILLAARALFELSRYIPSVLVVCLLALALVYPAFEERKSTFDTRHGWISAIQLDEETTADVEDLIAFLRAAPRGYVYAGMAKDWSNQLKLGGAVPLYHRLVVAGIPSLSILFHPFGLAGDVMFDFDLRMKDRYELFDVRYVVAPPKWTAPTFLRLVKHYRAYSLYEYSAATVLGVAHLAFEGWGTPSDAAQFMRRWLLAGAARNGVWGEIVKKPTGQLPAVAFSSQHLSHSLTSPSQGVQGSVQRSVRQQERVAGDITMKEPGLAVIKMGYHPSWKIIRNGELVNARWVTPGFMAVDIQEGVSALEISYVPSRFRGLLFVCCLFVPFGLAFAFSRSASLRKLVN
jgi:hypothetical protein